MKDEREYVYVFVVLNEIMQKCEKNHKAQHWAVNNVQPD